MRAWAGKADGTHRCACCTLPVKRDDVEYEPQTARGLYAHAECFTVWRAESDLVERERRQEPGAAAGGGSPETAEAAAAGGVRRGGSRLAGAAHDLLQVVRFERLDDVAVEAGIHRAF